MLREIGMCLSVFLESREIFRGYNTIMPIHPGLRAWIESNISSQAPCSYSSTKGVDRPQSTAGL